MSDTQFDLMAHNIARARIMLSVAAIVSVYIDPTTPDLTRWVSLSGGLFMIDAYALAVLALHLAYAAVTYALTSRWRTRHAWMGSLSSGLDVLFGVAVAVVTEGATSPAYVFFAFAILAVGSRSGFRVILQVTAACVALYLGVLFLSADHGAELYLMRPTYLAITGYLIAYLAQQRLDCEIQARKLETLTERRGIALALHDGYVQALAAVNLRLENCRTLLHRERHADALTELADLQRGIRHEYDEVRAYLRSLVDLERRESTSAIVGHTRFTIAADFAGSGVLVEQVLQILLEGVRNVRRHAQATSTVVSVTRTQEGVEIVIDDDGVGMGHGASVPWTIASRVEDCGGEVRMGDSSSRGAHLVVELPER